MLSCVLVCLWCFSCLIPAVERRGQECNNCRRLYRSFPPNRQVPAMSLNIATFSNVTGGNALFKALTQPKIADNARSLLAALRAAGPVAVYDPLGLGEAFADLYGVTGVNIGSVFVLWVVVVGRSLFGCVSLFVFALVC